MRLLTLFLVFSSACSDKDDTSNPDDTTDTQTDVQAVCEDGSAMTTYYADGDGDGFGDLADALDSCDVPVGYVAASPFESIGSDCDDTDAFVFPNADAYCDGQYNDCNHPNFSLTTIPNGERDEDGDGFVPCSNDGVPWAGAQIGGHDDCDDDNANVYPGGAEVCDGQYNDCSDPDYMAGSAPMNETDVDGDGYVECDSDGSTWSGTPIIGYNDCNDEDYGTYPGAGFNELNTADCMTDADMDGYAEPYCLTFEMNIAEGSSLDTGEFSWWYNAIVIVHNGEWADFSGDGYPDYFTYDINGTHWGEYPVVKSNGQTWCRPNDVVGTIGFELYEDPSFDGFADAMEMWVYAGTEILDRSQAIVTIRGESDGYTLNINGTSGYQDGDTLWSSEIASGTDCDGNDPISATQSNDADCDGSPTGVDCDDNDPTTFPGAIYNDFPDACLSTDLDQDGDGYGRFECMDLEMWDTFGDGWNGGHLILKENGVQINSGLPQTFDTYCNCYLPENSFYVTTGNTQSFTMANNPDDPFDTLGGGAVCSPGTLGSGAAATITAQYYSGQYEEENSYTLTGVLSGMTYHADGPIPATGTVMTLYSGSDYNDNEPNVH